MIGTRNEMLNMLKGGMGKKYYARRHPDNNLMIIQHKPCRKLRHGELPNQKVTHTNNVLLAAKEKAKAIYHNPELRDVWAQKFADLDAHCRKKGNRHINGGKTCGGYELPYTLWPWIYGECLREQYRESYL